MPYIIFITTTYICGWGQRNGCRKDMLHVVTAVIFRKKKKKKSLHDDNCSAVEEMKKWCTVAWGWNQCRELPRGGWRCLGCCVPDSLFIAWFDVLIKWHWILLFCNEVFLWRISASQKWGLLDHLSVWELSPLCHKFKWSLFAYAIQFIRLFAPHIAVDHFP